jgi:phosphatidylinositol alpha 1,6-mannosyltransferase
VSVLVGANDLVRVGARPIPLARDLCTGIQRLRDAGIDVLVVAPFAPRRRYLAALHSRMQRFNAVLRDGAIASGATYIDFSSDPACSDPRAWGEDRVHLSSHGHRVLAYRAAGEVGLPGMVELGSLDSAMHDEDDDAGDSWVPTARWLWAHVRPWLGRRVRGRTAGDGLLSKHTELVPVTPGDPRTTAAPVQ